MRPRRQALLLIDTPGYPDFIGQAIGAMRGVDTAAIVINAQSGIEVNTRRVFGEAKKAGLGRIIVINRMDADNIDFLTLVDNIQELFGKACVLLNVPLGQGADFRGVASTLKPPADAAGALIDPKEIYEPLLETIIEVDEEVMARYFEGTPPTDEEISRLIVKAVAQGLVGADRVRLRQDGRRPAGTDRGAWACACRRCLAAHGKNAAGEEVEVKADPAGPLVAQVFKTRIDPFVQKLSFVRVFSGTLKKDANVPVAGVRKRVKLSTLFSVQADETTRSTKSAPAGLWPWRRSRICTPAHRSAS